MKKSLYLLPILIITLLLLSGCFIGETTVLPVPEIVLSEDGSHISWEEIPYAVHYEVIIDGNKTIVRDATEYYFTTGGLNMTVSVRAIGDGLVYKSSEPVEITGTFTVALTTPVVTISRIIEDLHIEWLEVDNAIGYVIDINGVDLPIIDPSILTYVYPLPDIGTYNIGVKALAPENDFYVDSVRVVRNYVYTLPVPAAIGTGEVTAKTYDKASTGHIEFRIDINDDTTYLLTGEGIASANYMYNGSVLSINYTFLRSLDIGLRTFTFTTEQTSITLEITINDSRSPQLLSNGSNFNINVLANPDVEITLILNSATLTNVYLDNVLQVVNVDYAYSNSKVIFPSNDIYSWGIGTYEVKLVLNTGVTEHTLYYTISVIDTTDPYSNNISETFDRNNPTAIEFNLVLGMYQFDTVQGLLTQSDFTISGSKLTFKQAYLMTLPVGEYFFVVYTKNGVTPVNAFAISIEVINTSNACYNVRIDLDSHYPNVLLKWDYDGAATDFYYSINSGGSIQVTGAKQVVLSGVNKTNPFTYRVRPDSGSYPANSTWSPIAAGTSYMSQTYTFLGNTYDYYIYSQEEFNNYIYYACFDRTNATYGGTLPGGGANVYGYREMPEVFIAFDYGTHLAQGDDVSELSIAINSVPIKGSYSVASSMYSDGRVTFTIIYGSDEEPTLNKNSENNAVQNDFYPSHINELLGGVTRAPGYNGFAINSITKTQSVYSSEQLFNVVQSGIKPVPVSGSTAFAIYEDAKSILRTIINDNMSDYDKAHAIYDWLIFNVQYDGAVLALYNLNPNNPELNKYQCFYLEGVFNSSKRVAVCDGFAKAFVLLARIEGIEAVKVSGISNGVNHAWNKVRINNHWYTVDTTWGNITDTSYSTEHLTHAYLLVSDIDLYKSHRETEPTYASPQSYDYYKRSTYDGTNDYYITTQAEFNHIISTVVVGSGPIYLEIYNATGKTIAQLIDGYPGKQLPMHAFYMSPASVILFKFT